MPTRQETSTDAAPVSPLWTALPTVHGRLVSRRRLTGDLLEITLGGFGGFGGFGSFGGDDGRPWLERLTGGDQFVYALVSPEPDGIRPDYRMADLLERRPGDPVHGAYYTVRRTRPEVGELDLWVVDHGSPASAGDWMSTAPVGAPLALWGPRRGFEVPDDVRNVLFVADETGFAAVAASIELLPDDVVATAVLECRDAAHRPSMPAHPGLELIWVDRGDDAPGTTNRLLPAVRARVTAATDAGARDAGAPDAVFGAGESHHLSEIRRHMRPLGLAADRSTITGYWRRARR